MDKKFFEDMLSKDLKKDVDVEKMWDEKAIKFNAPNEKNHSGFSKRVIEILNSKNLLKGFDVLDVGGGGGRYAVPFSKFAKNVTMTDISGNMIGFAKEKAESQGAENIEFIKMVWEDADLENLNMYKKYDLVFSSMCPAVKTVEGLKKMIDASKNFCFINQLILDTDTFKEFIFERTSLEKKFDPHNDRDSLVATFNLLWIDGYDPEINYLSDFEEFELSLEEIYEKYHRLFNRVEEETGYKVSELIDEYIEKNGFKINKKRKMAMIHWEI